ncbi:hypothetical protein ABPG72_001770 [Tetrahymena utriculariae]
MIIQIFLIFLLFQLISSIQSFEYVVEISRKLAACSLASYCNIERLSNWSCKEACDRVEPLKDFIIYSGEKRILYIQWVTMTCKMLLQQQPEELCVGALLIGKQTLKLKKLITQTAKAVQFIRYSTKHFKLFSNNLQLISQNQSKNIPKVKYLSLVRVQEEPLQPQLSQKSISQMEKNHLTLFIHMEVHVLHQSYQQQRYYCLNCFYTHIGHEVFYKSFKNEFEYTMCEYPEDASCSEGEILAISVKDHGGYFGWNSAYEIFIC